MIGQMKREHITSQLFPIVGQFLRRNAPATLEGNVRKETVGSF